jgi:hypothetical protein
MRRTGVELFRVSATRRLESLFLAWHLPLMGQIEQAVCSLVIEVEIGCTEQCTSAGWLISLYRLIGQTVSSSLMHTLLL